MDVGATPAAYVPNLTLAESFSLLIWLSPWWVARYRDLTPLFLFTRPLYFIVGEYIMNKMSRHRQGGAIDLKVGKDSSLR